jgi:hypothetical protein
MSMCRRHGLFEICPECIREVRQHREYMEWLQSSVERDGIAANKSRRMQPYFQRGECANG